MSLPIERSSDTPLRPKDIDGENGLYSAFGNREAEVTALALLRYCQLRGSWKPFAFEDLVAYCSVGQDVTKTKSYLDKGIETLTMGEFLIRKGDRIILTTAFVARCYQKAPVLGVPRKRVRKPKSKDPVRTRFERLRDRNII